MTAAKNSSLILHFERRTKLTSEQIFNAWTLPDLWPRWFCPRPWKVTEGRIQLRPGGEFFIVMEGPQGEHIENNGCVLDVEKNKYLIWTNMMTENFQPTSVDIMGFPFVGTIALTQEDSMGCLYRASVAHANSEDLKKHEEMGFHKGWGLAFDQMEQMYELQERKVGL